MRKVLDHATVAGVPSQFSLDRFIKCGVGLCGSCCIDPSGLRVCSDGPVFAGARLQESDFGVYIHDATGRKGEFVIGRFKLHNEIFFRDCGRNAR